MKVLIGVIAFMAALALSEAASCSEIATCASGMSTMSSFNKERDCPKFETMVTCLTSALDDCKAMGGSNIPQNVLDQMESTKTTIKDKMDKMCKGSGSSGSGSGDGGNGSSMVTPKWAAAVFSVVMAWVVTRI